MISRTLIMVVSSAAICCRVNIFFKRFRLNSYCFSTYQKYNTQCASRIRLDEPSTPHTFRFDWDPNTLIFVILKTELLLQYDSKKITFIQWFTRSAPHLHLTSQKLNINNNYFWWQNATYQFIKDTCHSNNHLSEFNLSPTTWPKP